MPIRLPVVSAGVVGLLLAVPIAAAAVKPPELLAGTYQQVNPVTHKVLDPGNSIVFVRTKAGKIGFSINAIRALDSNQGNIAGSFAAARKVVWTQQNDLGNCKLTFTAVPGGMAVVQDSKFGDCGFGAGVVADGTYAWVREK